MDIIVFVLAVVVVGLLVCLFVCIKKHAVVEKTKDVLLQDVERLQTEREKLVADVELLREEKSAIAIENGVLKEKLDNAATVFKGEQARHKDALEEQKRYFADMMASVSDKVQVATDKLLKKRQKEFEESSVTNLGQIVNPLKETIDKMKNAMADSAKEQTEMSSAMKENIRHLMEQTKATKSSADELAKALKHGTKVQGDWGETILDELLHSQGFTKGVHYDVQATMRDADGKTIHNATGGTMRPDVILHLDEQRDVIIDSKVSLTAFMDYVNAENEADRQRYLKQHVESLQKHVKELSVKDYSLYIASPKLKMDYVIMFVPHTGALWTALNEQPDLWRRAMDMNVFVADEQTLFAALRIINLTWTQIVQAQNHERVYALANEMLDRVGQFYERFQSIGAALDKAKVAYDDAGKKLEPSGQSIIQTGNKLKKLGAKQNDKHPIPEIISDGELS
ncbi:MAG: DNA recombination protein RmuC [Bacteroidaceae bacterium]|nr:DNA recombination protein RmuC [Bacteroidaceae bacterium]